MSELIDTSQVSATVGMRFKAGMIDFLQENQMLSNDYLLTFLIGSLGGPFPRVLYGGFNVIGSQDPGVGDFWLVTGGVAYYSNFHWPVVSPGTNSYSGLEFLPIAGYTTSAGKIGTSDNSSTKLVVVLDQQPKTSGAPRFDPTVLSNGTSTDVHFQRQLLVVPNGLVASLYPDSTYVCDYSQLLHVSELNPSIVQPIVTPMISSAITTAFTLPTWTPATTIGNWTPSSQGLYYRIVNGEVQMKGGFYYDTSHTDVYPTSWLDTNTHVLTLPAGHIPPRDIAFICQAQDQDSGFTQNQPQPVGVRITTDGFLSVCPVRTNLYNSGYISPTYLTQDNDGTVTPSVRATTYVENVRFYTT